MCHCAVWVRWQRLFNSFLNRVLEKVEPACEAGRISRFEPGIVPLLGWIDELLGVDVFLSFRFSLCFISFHLSLGGSCGRQCVQLSGVGPPSGSAEDSDASIQGVRAREERYGRVRCRVSTKDSRVLRVYSLFFQLAHLRTGKRACTFKNRQVFSFMLIIWIICSECEFLLEEVPFWACYVVCEVRYMHIIDQDTREGSAYAINKVNDVWS